MNDYRFFWRIFPAFLIITALALFVLAWFASRSFRDSYLDRTTQQLDTVARMVENELADTPIEPQHPPVFDEFCRSFASGTDVRITLILASGEVIGDSREKAADMEDHYDRPEVVQSLAEGVGQAIRFSSTLQQNMMYRAHLHSAEGKPAWIVRTSVAVDTIQDSLTVLYMRIFWGGLFVLLSFAVVSFFFSRSLSRKLRITLEAANHFAEGDLNYRIKMTGISEIDELGRSLNTMAQELDDKLRTVTRQRNEREAILSSMVEGVLAVDADEHLLIINASAAQMVGVEMEWARGRTIQEVVRNNNLQQLIRRVLSRGAIEEIHFSLHGAGERYFQAHSTPLRQAEGAIIGAIIVIHDITPLKRLENIRRDFVANVSHELKTPITSIKGFVETLLDGTLEDRQQAERFITIIAKQVDRLNAIIEDLLELARLEQIQERSNVHRSIDRVRDPLIAAVETCRRQAEEKDIHIELHCDENLNGKINAALIEEAVVNLVDNAIKYSEPGSRVQVVAESENSGIAIHIIDEGCGIPGEHISRIFERFYRIDKARSRKMGGTGLGLAIVKHIAQAHNGSVDVTSTPGRGSTFTIRLPGHLSPEHML
ncbi:MAG: PAS domain-containing protein [Acidobacteria bacterium]|nr:PAS domain-containing protein [Acidobacteriota bacterium]